MESNPTKVSKCCRPRERNLTIKENHSGKSQTYRLRNGEENCRRSEYRKWKEKIFLINSLNGLKDLKAAFPIVAKQSGGTKYSTESCLIRGLIFKAHGSISDIKFKTLKFKN